MTIFFIALFHEGRKGAVFPAAEMFFGKPRRNFSDQTIQPNLRPVFRSAFQNYARRTGKQYLIEYLSVPFRHFHRYAAAEGMGDDVRADDA